MNKAIISGFLGMAPELRQINDTTCVANFTLATNDGFGDNKKTNWHRVTVWNKTAENCAKYLDKGSKALVEGRIEYGEYTDKEGNTKKTVDIVANNVEFLDSKPKDEVVPF